MFGLATADTSLSVRCGHPVSVCAGGLDSNPEQPEPVPSPPELLPQTLSFQPPPEALSDVPPTETTYGDAAG